MCVYICVCVVCATHIFVFVCLLNVHCVQRTEYVYNLAPYAVYRIPSYQYSM